MDRQNPDINRFHATKRNKCQSTLPVLSGGIEIDDSLTNMKTNFSEDSNFKRLGSDGKGYGRFEEVFLVRFLQLHGKKRK